MAMQLKTVAIKLFNPSLNLVRNRSGISMPPLFWDPLDPFERRRNFWSNIFTAPQTPQPFNEISPIHRYPVIPIYSREKAPIRNEKDGFDVSLNVENFAPNEISVRVMGNTILVEANHEERAENGGRYFSQQLKQHYALSNEFSVKDVVSTLSSDGILTVKVPRVPPKELNPQNIRRVNIEQTGRPARNEIQNQKEQH